MQNQEPISRISGPGEEGGINTSRNNSLKELNIALPASSNQSDLNGIYTSRNITLKEEHKIVQQSDSYNVISNN